MSIPFEDDLLQTAGIPQFDLPPVYSDQYTQPTPCTYPVPVQYTDYPQDNGYLPPPQFRYAPQWTLPSQPQLQPQPQPPSMRYTPPGGYSQPTPYPLPPTASYRPPLLQVSYDVGTTIAPDPVLTPSPLGSHIDTSLLSDYRLTLPRIQTNEAELRNAEAMGAPRFYPSLHSLTRSVSPASASPASGNISPAQVQVQVQPSESPLSSPNDHGDNGDNDANDPDFRPAKRSRRKPRRRRPPTATTPKPSTSTSTPATLTTFTTLYPLLSSTYPLFHEALSPDLTMAENAAPMIGTIRADPLDKCARMKEYFHQGRRRISQLDAFVSRCADAEEWEWPPLTEGLRTAIVGVRRKIVERCENYKYNRRDILDRILGKNKWPPIEENSDVNAGISQESQSQSQSKSQSKTTSISTSTSNSNSTSISDNPSPSHSPSPSHPPSDIFEITSYYHNCDYDYTNYDYPSPPSNSTSHR